MTTPTILPIHFVLPSGRSSSELPQIISSVQIDGGLLLTVLIPSQTYTNTIAAVETPAFISNRPLYDNWPLKKLSYLCLQRGLPYTSDREKGILIRRLCDYDLLNPGASCILCDVNEFEDVKNRNYAALAACQLHAVCDDRGIKLPSSPKPSKAKIIEYIKEYDMAQRHAVSRAVHRGRRGI